MPVGVGTVEFTDRDAGVGKVGVCYVGSTGGTTGAVEAEREGLEGADFGEEALWEMLV